jgi:N-dimethylarginine dimethylaminohydrolase
MRRQHQAMEQILQQEGIEIVWLNDPTGKWTNLTFTRDVAMMTPKGAILTRFAMYFHQGDTCWTQKCLADQNIPLLGAIQGRGTAEGGAFCLLDPHTAIISRSVRVNDEGIDQLRELLSRQDIELIAVDLPASIIHLDEAFVPVDRDKILVSTFLLQYWFLSMMAERGYQLIETDPEDPPLTNNCLTLAPGRVLFNVHGSKTRKNLEAAGIEVIPSDLSEINKLGGGLHCATLPLWRDHLE